MLTLSTTPKTHDAELTVIFPKMQLYLVWGISIHYGGWAMQVSGINAETGEKIVTEAPKVSLGFIQEMASLDLSDTQIKRVIDNLNISADAKSALYSLSKVVITAGEYVLRFGRKIIDFIASIHREFPNASFGLIFGAIVGFLITAIPLIGAFIGAFVGPIVMAYGLVMGLSNDIQDKALARRIAEANAKFAPLAS